ncbi:Snx41p [Saccharomyces cerevisiae x Saccharomyces kudriavzevii VIN7]|uniref:Snx41p n=1 Tax=Saccharomyces cerevisiae x Saccharomyces kudriavzevii (strain VIN7) TaxID=1095631 RepID=H0GTC9_SACCK|nr:Snx41p [Saccharomyces cerevisiae x Saccharomyces kudriavzevii VIN7]
MDYNIFDGLHEQQSSGSEMDLSEEDNNPFVGTHHLYASGIGTAIGEARPENIHSPPSSSSLPSSPAHSSSAGSSRASTTSSTSSHAVVEADAETEPFVSLSMSTTTAAITKNAPHDTNGTEQIQIIDAGDFKDPWGKHAIGYVILYENNKIIRRYSEFHSLKQSLARLLPTIIIPPIPSKHSLFKYIWNPINATNDSKIISTRKKMLNSFLSNCLEIQEICNDTIFRKFLNPEYNWKDVLSSSPIIILPLNNLLAPPLNPTKPSPLHTILPIPSNSSLKNYNSIWQQHITMKSHNEVSNLPIEIVQNEPQFTHIENLFQNYRRIITHLLKNIRSNKSHFHSLSTYFAELGAYYNAFSLENDIAMPNSGQEHRGNLKNPMLEIVSHIEKIGHSFDIIYISSEILIEKYNFILEEPISELLQFLNESFKVLNFKKLKFLQYKILEKLIIEKETKLANLTEIENQLQKINESLTHSTILTDDNNTDTKAVEPTFVKKNIRSLSKSSSNSNSSGHQSEIRIGTSKLNYKTTIPTMNLNKLEIKQLTKQERSKQIKQLVQDLSKLKDCLSICVSDMLEINTSSYNSLMHMYNQIHLTVAKILKLFTTSFKAWIKECLENWKLAKSQIDQVL